MAFVPRERKWRQWTMEFFQVGVWGGDNVAGRKMIFMFFENTQTNYKTVTKARLTWLKSEQ